MEILVRQSPSQLGWWRRPACPERTGQRADVLWVFGCVHNELRTSLEPRTRCSWTRYDSSAEGLAWSSSHEWALRGRWLAQRPERIPISLWKSGSRILARTCFLHRWNGMDWPGGYCSESRWTARFVGRPVSNAISRYFPTTRIWNVGATTHAFCYFAPREHFWSFGSITKRSDRRHAIDA